MRMHKYSLSASPSHLPSISLSLSLSLPSPFSPFRPFPELRAPVSPGSHVQSSHGLRALSFHGVPARPFRGLPAASSLGVHAPAPLSLELLLTFVHFPLFSSFPPLAFCVPLLSFL